MKHNYLLDFVTNLQAQGRYSFSLNELKYKWNIKTHALRNALNRLVNKGRILSIYKGFYIIIPAEYSSTGILPPALFIHDLMQYLNKPYYAGVISAAVFYGATHQQAQEFYIITAKPQLRPVNKKGIKVNFLARSYFPKSNIESVKTDMGMLLVSNPKLTAIDLIAYNKRIGGLNRAIEIISEMKEKIKFDNINDFNFGNIPIAVLQRLGYIFEIILDDHELSFHIFKIVKNKEIFFVPLNSANKKAGFSRNAKWKIIENSKYEGSL